MTFRLDFFLTCIDRRFVIKLNIDPTDQPDCADIRLMETNLSSDSMIGEARVNLDRIPIGEVELHSFVFSEARGFTAHTVLHIILVLAIIRCLFVHLVEEQNRHRDSTRIRVRADFHYFDEHLVMGPRVLLRFIPLLSVRTGRGRRSAAPCACATRRSCIWRRAVGGSSKRSTSSWATTRRATRTRFICI